MARIGPSGWANIGTHCRDGIVTLMGITPHQEADDKCLRDPPSRGRVFKPSILTELAKLTSGQGSENEEEDGYIKGSRNH